MTKALTITNWIVTFFFVITTLFTAYDLFFPKETYSCVTVSMSFIIVFSFPLSFLILVISFFEIRKLLRHEWGIEQWQEKAYWIKAALSSFVALLTVVFAVWLIISELIPSSC